MPGTVAAPSADPRSLSERELVEHGSVGDSAALREIMRRNSPRLYRLARTVLRNESEAEHVLQETYLRPFGSSRSSGASPASIRGSRASP